VGDSPVVDPNELRDEVRAKYRDVAAHPDAAHHFHTGRRLSSILGYDGEVVAGMPDRAVESFAGVGNPFSIRPLQAGERVVDVGSGAGFDSFIAAELVGATGAVVGVDMTAEMLSKSRATAQALGIADRVEFREGLAESLPVEDSWADVVISNGVINLCPDKRAVFEEIRRVLRPGGVLQFADIANGRPVPEEAMRQIDLWTG
jgi:arsenite methyltransferase